MKKNWKNISLIGFGLFFAACNNSAKQANTVQQKQSVVYTCPMHSQVHEDHPGNCPICGMTLVKKSAQVSASASISLNTVLLPVNASVISSVPAITPIQEEMADTIFADGYLDYDTRTFNNIAARFSGRIEKLYIKYSFQEIYKGQRIMDVYSPDMVTAQQDLLYVQRNSPNETGLINAAWQKLLLLGMTGAEINTVIKTGKVFYDVPVYSPYDGHVHDMAHSQAGATEAMSEPVVDYSQTIPLAVKEGMYVAKGQTLFNVVDPHRLWAVLKIRQANAGQVRTGQPVSIIIPDEGMNMDGQVNFIEPVFQAGDKTTSARVYLANMMHSMKVGSLVKAKILTGKHNGLWLPKTAVISLGLKKIVWLKQGASYRAQEVQTGIQTDSVILITSGLSLADSVASNGQYLADSESFIKTESHEKNHP
jgi:Cu(I)/Ag(I) efflux system membrane fusion protein